MANHNTNSPSPRLSPVQGFTRAFNHGTPGHSAHNSQQSFHSSTSSRNPHSLSIHEYRKLQNSPASLSATPPGKTLRRKAAASALKELERVPSVKRTSTEAFPQSRLIHLSHSAHQLTIHQPLPPSPPLFSEDSQLLDSSFRSQLAEPRVLATADPVGYSSLSSTSTSSKVRNLKPRKKLPKPLPRPLPANSTSGTPVPVFHNTPISSTDTHSTPSSFSLSRFPHPPYPHRPAPLQINSHKEGNVPPRLKTSFTAVAPVTPPATPAVIHYRGASFDLVNPHDSLLLHDIETPSRDLDSTDYSPERSSEEPLLKPEMAPRRALYGDLTSAYSSIRRKEENPNTPDSEFPSPPAPAHLSPESSTYSSPVHGYNSSLGVPPLALRKKDPGDSRFSLADMTPIRKLTHAITKKLGKGPDSTEQSEGQELQELSPATPAQANFEGEYPRPLEQSYTTIPSPSTYGSPAIQSPISEPEENASALRSMIPDDPSSQMGRTKGRESVVSTGLTGSKPYYEEVASLYPSSSIYTGEAEEGGPPSTYSRRESAAFGSWEYGHETYTNPFRRESTYDFTTPDQSGFGYSSRITEGRDMSSQFVHNDKTDTISKFIGQYEGQERVYSSSHTSREAAHPSQLIKGSSTFSRFDLLPRQPGSDSGSRSSFAGPSRAQSSRARRPTVTQTPGSPPQRAAPLEPAFEYDEIPEIFNRPHESDAFSPISSYDDTRNLLQLSQGVEEGAAAIAGASEGSLPTAQEPSSSYSQSEHQPVSRTVSSTPQEALDQAEQIFDEASGSQSIPAIWSRRGSGNLFRSRQAGVPEAHEQELADWETIGNKSAASRADDDSIADYSSTSEERRASRLSGGIYGDVPLPASPPAHQRHRHLYQHPPHGHPFSSSPPPLSSRASLPSSPEEDRVTFGLSLTRTGATVPAFNTAARGRNDEPYFFMPDPAPWTREEPSPYALSDKETLELLNSGPNEEIEYETTPGDNRPPDLKGEHRGEDGWEHQRVSRQSSEPEVLHLSPLHANYNSVALPRDNSFSKITRLGPKGNLTGTPLGTGMKEVGSSLADNSSPGADWSSSISSRGRTGPGFYIDPKAKASKTSIRRPAERVRSPSQETLSPPHARLNIFPNVPEHSPVPKGNRPRSRNLHRHGRSAVPGQTRLREMVLAPRTESVHSNVTRFSDLMRADASIRPSSTGTNAPLRPHGSATSAHIASGSRTSVLTPHLRTPAREPKPEEEEQRRKLSWIIFAVFCLLPPLLMLYRWLADSVICWVSGGRFESASVAPKRVALHAGAPLNIVIVIAIIAPIIVVNA